MKVRLLITAGLYGILGIMGPRLANGDIVIDSFEDRPAGFPIVASGYGIITSDQGRGIGVNVTLGLPKTETITVDFGESSGVDFLSYVSTGQMFGNLQLGYGADYYTPPPAIANMYPLGLEVQGKSCLELDFLEYNSSSGLGMAVTALISTGLSPNDASTTLTQSTSSFGPQVVLIPLDSLQGSTINSVNFTFNALPGTMFDLDKIAFIANVPEPNGILYLGAAAPLLIRRKKLC